MADSSPTVRQRELGLRLRQLRTDLGWTVDDVADKLMCSAAKVSRLETGARRPMLRDVRDLCELYQVDEATAAEFMKLTRQAREQGWWARYDDLNLYPYIGLEQDAQSITAYSLYWLPGLVQSEDYARAIIRAISPKIADEVLEQRVQARMERQQVLYRGNPPRYRVLLDELVLRRQVGSAAIMAAQIDKILKMIEDGRVTLQIVPFGAGAYPAADIMFLLLEFDERLLSPVVFVESLVHHQYHERADDIVRYREAIENVRDIALNPRESARYLAAVGRVWAGGGTFAAAVPAGLREDINVN